MSAAATAIPRSRAPKLGLILVVIAVIGGLAALDMFLEGAEQAELADQAQRAYVRGSRLAQAGKAAEAIDALRRAHALERKNLIYELQLITVLTAAGKTSEAEPLMNEVLDAGRNDGAANLVAARLRLKEGKLVDSEAYYHRAIYGQWPQDAAAHRMAARLELIDLLVAKNQKEDLLAELLPLEEEARNNPTIQLRLARLFLIAGSPSRAADVYRALVREQPENAQAHEGLGEAELELGDYGAAHAAFKAAFAQTPNDSNLRSKLQLASTLASLDPTPRWLPSAEKYQRSLRILEWAQQDLEKCIQRQPSGASGEQQNLLERAEDAMDYAKPAQMTNESSEGGLSLAEKIWQARLSACGPATAPDEEALRLIMAKLVQ
ncbi:MAG TPA: tetratricopeptide repeat protein [Bryobacteraceae bacterium]|jgi:tetratricopeptide (TPR) repeat protein|nr:tetratricopeptide repeat protein [Bryobacteraceae bacterium]